MKLKLRSLLLFSLLLASSSLFAQKYTGTLLGTVKDQSGAVVPNATITVTNSATGATRIAKTNSNGEYTVAELPAGTYEVKATAASFKEELNKGVEIHVSSDTAVNMQLQAGSAVEVVTVEAHAVQVETSTGAAGGVIGEQQVRELPLNGRNFVQLTTLLPGAAVTEGFDNQNKGLLAGVDISFSGAPSNANQWRVDGANNNDIGSQRTILIYPSVDSIEEFKILRNSYGPEYGGAGGAQVNLVTKGGGNNLHGTAYYFGRNDALNAKSYFLSTTPPAGSNVKPPCLAGDLSCQKQKLRSSDYGYTIGGPIKKDKAFFYLSQEWNPVTRGAPRKAWVPTAAERTGNFSDIAGCGSSRPVPNDPLTGQPFPGNIIPANRLSTAGQAWVSQISLPNVSNPCAINNWVQSVNIPLRDKTIGVRGDLNVTKNTVVSLHYTQDIWDNPTHSYPERGLWGEQAFPALSDSWDQPGKVAIAKLTSTLSNTSVNDFSFSWSANRINITTGGDTPGLNNQIKSVFPTVFPQSNKLHGANTAAPICWCAGFPNGFLGHFGPWNNNQDLFTWKDDFSKVSGKHTFKFGAYFSKNLKDEETGQDSGSFWGPTGHTDPTNAGANWNGFTNNQYGDMLVKGIIWGGGENVRNGKAHARWSDSEFYFGDSWKLRPRFTLEYGVRYSLSPPEYDANNNYASFRPDLFNPALGNDACNGVVVPTGNTECAAIGAKGGLQVADRSLVPSNYHLIAPRLGFAWDVFGNGRFAFRGGVGQFYSRNPVGELVQIESNTSPVAIAPGFERTLDSPTGPGGVLLDFAAAGSPAQGAENTTNTANNWQWNLNTETELWKDTKLELGWVALRGIHLNSSTAANEVTPANRLNYINQGILGNTSAQQALLPFHPFTGAQVIWDNRGDSVYHSLQAMFTSKFSRNSTFQASYTWSKNIADTTLAYVGNNTGLADTYNTRIGRGPADFDRRHILSANLVYNLPTLDNWNSFAKNTIGGWETTSVLSFFTGVGLKMSGSVNSMCDTDLIADATKTNCADGRFKSFSGNPWGIGASEATNSSPNRVANQNCYTSSGGRLAHLNTNAFSWDGFALGGYPNAGPGTCTGPGVQDVDFSIAHNWKLPFGQKIFGEQSRLQFRLETFNLFNHPMFIGTNTNVSVTGGLIKNGVISCAGGQGAAPCALNNSQFGQAATPSNLGNREVQYALKFIF